MEGMEKPREVFRQLMNTAIANETRRQHGIKVPEPSMHMLFTGNPGTGKTEMAKAIGKAYYGMGLVGKDSFVHIKDPNSELIDPVVGMTPQKVQRVFDKARGGVLFIDEFSNLTDAARSGTGYAGEALNTMIPLIEEYRHDTVVIMAGYSKNLPDLFAVNEGYESRFRTRVDFPDYSDEALVKIAPRIAERDYEMQLSPEAQKRMPEVLARWDATQRNGNARSLRNEIDTAITRMNNRLAPLVNDDGFDMKQLQVLTPEDFGLPTRKRSRAG